MPGKSAPQKTVMQPPGGVTNKNDLFDINQDQSSNKQIDFTELFGGSTGQTANINNSNPLQQNNNQGGNDLMSLDFGGQQKQVNNNNQIGGLSSFDNPLHQQ